jgi:putative MATE family efflux protein
MKNNLLEGSIPKHMIRLALPSIIGMLSLVIFNITDTYFVSQLGDNALAAMGYTFPVIMIVGSISSGISAGASSMLSRAKGANDNHLMKRIATDGILLSLITVALVSVIGLVAVKPIFIALGASGEVLELVTSYMKIWFMFVAVAMTPPVVDSYMRALGDMIRPLFVMLTCAIINIILDYFLIFGVWIFPELGIQGAAIATVIARAFGMVLTLYFITSKYGLINFEYYNKTELFKSWGSIMLIGFPSIFTLIMPQILRTIMTSLASSQSDYYVAAMAASLRIESFPIIILAGVGMSLIPLIGQNWGAKKYERVYEVRKTAIKMAIGYGLAVFIFFMITSKHLATIFTSNQITIDSIVSYLNIMIIGSVGVALANWMSKAFTTIGKPKFTLAINAGGVGLFVIPLAFIGFMFNGFIGMLIFVSFGNIALGISSVFLSYKYLKPE